MNTVTDQAKNSRVNSTPHLFSIKKLQMKYSSLFQFYIALSRKYKKHQEHYKYSQAFVLPCTQFAVRFLSDQSDNNVTEP